MVANCRVTVALEMLSDHPDGWLEGYLLTGRHGFFHTYSLRPCGGLMFNQHAKWLDISKNHVPWRASVASQNILFPDSVAAGPQWLLHQDPGFIDRHQQKSECYAHLLAPDATLLAVVDECLRSTG